MKATKTLNANEIPTRDATTDETSNSQSYKEKLLNTFGESSSEYEPWDEEEDEKDFPKNKWYDEEKMNGPPEPKPFNPRPEVTFTDEELDQWSKPWRNTLIVKVLGKRVSFSQIEAKLNKEWTTNGAIKITNMAYGFFLVRLQSQKDYKTSFFDGPWKIAYRYLIVQR